MAKAKNAGAAEVKIDPVKDAEVREKLITARIGLLLRSPFFGNLATRLTLINADSWCQTAATDGRNFYYNTEFIHQMPLKQVEFLFGHEVMHAVYGHIWRRGYRDPVIWNIAGDYCINWDLVENHCGEKIPSALYDAKYKDMSADEVYDDLVKNATKKDIDKLAKQLLDEHLSSDDEGESGDGEGEGGDRSHSGGARPHVDGADGKKIQDEIREAVLASATAVGAGNLPSSIARLIKELTQPVMNWREMLQQQIESTIKSNFSWTRPSRRSWHMDAIMPGMINGSQIDVVVAIDTSGSISDTDLRDFLSEVKGIMETYLEYKIHVISWNTAVHNPEIFTSDNLTDIEAYNPGPSGGTEPHCIWDWLSEEGIEPKKLIVFTDYCFCGWSPKKVANYCDTVWVIKGNKDAEPEFGVWAIYENEAGKS